MKMSHPPIVNFQFANEEKQTSLADILRNTGLQILDQNLKNFDTTAVTLFKDRDVKLTNLVLFSMATVEKLTISKNASSHQKKELCLGLVRYLVSTVGGNDIKLTSFLDEVSLMIEGFIKIAKSPYLVDNSRKPRCC